ncbi:MAG: hypothetical protein ACN6OP_06120 [Pseudomonadales bacterium]
MNKQENGVGWRRIRQRRQSKKPNQINDKRRRSSTCQRVAHVRCAHDDWIHFYKNLLYSNNLASSSSHHVAILLHPTADPGFTGVPAVDRSKRFTE